MRSPKQNSQRLTGLPGTPMQPSAAHTDKDTKFPGCPSAKLPSAMELTCRRTQKELKNNSLKSGHPRAFKKYLSLMSSRLCLTNTVLVHTGPTAAPPRRVSCKSQIAAVTISRQLLPSACSRCPQSAHCRNGIGKYLAPWTKKALSFPGTTMNA